MKVQLKNIMTRSLAILFATASLVNAGTEVSDLWTKSLTAETDGDYMYALEVHQTILPKLRTSYVASLRAGWLYYMNKDYGNALKSYERAAGQSSGALAPLYGAMNCHLAEQRTDKVVKVAKSILVIDELNYTATKQLAAVYYEEGSFSLAAAYYRKLNRLYPEDLAVTSGLAWSYLEQGESRKALPLFKEILMVSPDYAYAQRGLEICNRIAK